MPLLGLVPEDRHPRVSVRCRENGFWPSPPRSEASRSEATGLGSTGCMQREKRLWLPLTQRCCLFRRTRRRNLLYQPRAALISSI